MESPTRIARAVAIFFDGLERLDLVRIMKNSAPPKLATMAINAMAARYGMTGIIG